LQSPWGRWHGSCSGENHCNAGPKPASRHLAASANLVRAERRRAKNAINRRNRRRAFTLTELLSTFVIVSVLLAIGLCLGRGARHSARTVVAQGNLRQVAVGLELYFRKFFNYPAESDDLVTPLSPFVGDPRVFRNPLDDEPVPGRTLSLLYHQPTPAQIDSPHFYVTALLSTDRSTAVILKTGGIVERHDGLHLPPDDLRQAALTLDLQWGRYRSPGASLAGPAGPTGPDEPEGEPLSGAVNLNPKNNNDFEFELRRPDGSTLTRDHLHASGGSLDFSGPAAWIRFTPKGNGNQNSLTLDGKPYEVSNARTYVITGGAIQTHVYNSSKSGGKATGKWWLAVNAAHATITASK